MKASVKRSCYSRVWYEYLQRSENDYGDKRQKNPIIPFLSFDLIPFAF